jgi:hypothetical protein
MNALSLDSSVMAVSINALMGALAAMLSVDEEAVTEAVVVALAAAAAAAVVVVSAAAVVMVVVLAVLTPKTVDLAVAAASRMAVLAADFSLMANVRRMYHCVR